MSLILRGRWQPLLPQWKWVIQRVELSREKGLLLVWGVLWGGNFWFVISLWLSQHPFSQAPGHSFQILPRLSLF